MFELYYIYILFKKYIFIYIIRHTRSAAAAHPLEIEVSNVERRNLQGVSCRPNFVCGIPYITFVTGTQEGIRELSTVGCILELYFYSFFSG